MQPDVAVPDESERGCNTVGPQGLRITKRDKPWRPTYVTPPSPLSAAERAEEFAKYCAEQAAAEIRFLAEIEQDKVIRDIKIETLKAERDNRFLYRLFRYMRTKG